VKEHGDGTGTYCRQMLGAAIFHPDFQKAFALPPEPILRGDGATIYDGPLTVADVVPRLAEHEFFHNYRRPHWALDCRTPNECLVGIEDAA